jgi:hypothetical protein
MERLIVEVFKAKAEDVTRLKERVNKDGEFEYTYFVNPETGKYYRPCEGFTVEMDEINEGFVEVM